METVRPSPIVRSHGGAAVVMVQASPEAEAICNKSSLGVVDLLRPYSFVDEKFQLTTVGEPYQLKGFALRFVHTSEFTELAADAADAHLQRLLSSYDCAAELAETEKLDLPLPEGPAPSLPPLRSGSTQWITAFREQLAGALRNSEGASLDHPVSCVLVASALQPKVTSVFNALLSHVNLTPVIAEGVADPGFARSYILLHDASDPSADMGAAQAALAEASRAFGAAACHLLTINTREANQPLPADIWTSARPLHHSPPAGSKREAAGGLPGESPLSEGDVTNLQALIEGPLTKQILGSLQSRVVALSSTVKAARAGLQNKLRSWLGSKSHGHSGPSAVSTGRGEGSVRYVCGSIEAQTRQLADCAYLLGDYSTALTAYRQVSGAASTRTQHLSTHPPSSPLTLLTHAPSHPLTCRPRVSSREIRPTGTTHVPWR